MTLRRSRRPEQWLVLKWPIHHATRFMAEAREVRHAVYHAGTAYCRSAGERRPPRSSRRVA